MLRLFLAVLAIIVLAAVIGIDECTCGYGPSVRRNLKSLFRAMRHVRLIPISHHGKNRFREAGFPEEWLVMSEKPGKLLVQPSGHPDAIRWVSLVGDPDFEVEDVEEGSS